MDDLNDIKAIWLSADTERLPAAEEIRSAAHKFRSSKLWKTAGLILATLLLTLMEGWVWFVYKSTMLTTWAGEVCVILAGLTLIITNLNTLHRFYKYKDLSNKDFIAFLNKTRQRQLLYHQKTQVLGLSLVSIGLLLYPFEIVHNNIIALVIVYLFTTAFLLFMWLVIRKRNFRKQDLKLKAMIQKMKDLSTQL